MMMLSVSKVHLYSLLALLLVVSCECKDMHVRRIPEEKDIAFKGEVKTAKKSVYRKGKSRDIQIHLTSNDEEAKDAQFKILSATLADGSPADLDYTSLKLGDNTLSYTPKGPGTHALTIKVAVEGEEEHAQIIHYTLEAPAANWQVSGTADATGNLSIQIADAPEELQGEPWKITNTTWSGGLRGTIVENTLTLNCGENNLQVALTHIALERPPVFHVKIEGPDQEEASIAIDLTEACVAQLIANLYARNTEAKQWINDAKTILAQAVEDTETARIEHCSKLETLVAQAKIFHKNHQKNIDNTKKSLSIIDEERLKIQFLENEGSGKTLGNKIKELDHSIYVLKQGSLNPEELLFGALKHKDDATINACLSGNIDVRAVDTQGKTLLHRAVLENNIEAAKKLINKRADVNAVAIQGQTALFFAAKSGNIEMVKLLYDSEGDLSVKMDSGVSLLQLAARYRSPEVLAFFIEKFREKRLNLGNSDAKRKTAIHYLAISSNRDFYNQRGPDRAPWLATLEIRKKMLKLLLDCDEINPSQEDHKGKIAFSEAALELQDYWRSLYPLPTS